MIPLLARFRVPLGFVFAVVVFLLAHPTRRTLVAGVLVALAGEAVRVWAAGHLEKGREVTSSGPYRWARHPLYVGTIIMGAGLAIASASWIVAALVAVYLATTLTSAVRTEEAFLRETFGGEYDAYCRGRTVARRFSPARAMRNREHRALLGILAGLLLLALKTS
jgi:protein-S-isoprenylcysteine O-methyltransferase Ste14